MFLIGLLVMIAVIGIVATKTSDIILVLAMSILALCAGYVLSTDSIKESCDTFQKTSLNSSIYNCTLILTKQDK